MSKSLRRLSPCSEDFAVIATEGHKDKRSRVLMIKGEGDKRDNDSPPVINPLFNAGGGSPLSEATAGTMGAVAPLVNGANNVVTGRKRDITARQRRYQRRDVSARWLCRAYEKEISAARENNPSAWLSSLPRPATCGYRLGSLVGVNVKDGRGYFDGIARCGSIHACPSCSAVIRKGRADDIGKMCENADEQGFGGFFLTLTLRHDKGRKLADLLDALSLAWRKLQSQSGYRRLMKRVGSVGFVRSTEITYGVNGWHPHSHMIFWTENKLSPAEIENLDAELSEMWSKAVLRVGDKGITPSRDRGVDVRVITSGGIASYLGKLQDGKSNLELELARGDLKKGRKNSLVPFELLDNDTPDNRRLWVEYFEATKNRRVFAYSRGIRKKLGVGVAPSDEEILEAAAPADAPQFLLWVLDGAEYDSLRKNGKLASELLRAEVMSMLGHGLPFIRELPDSDFWKKKGRLWGQELLSPLSGSRKPRVNFP